MYLTIVLLPLLGSIVSGFFGRNIGVKGAQIITSFCIVTTTILAGIVFFEVGMNNIPVSIKLGRWIDSESFNIYWAFTFDSLTVSMLLPVLIVSSLVHIYSIGYMSHDPHNQRFFSYLSLFTFMMIILVTANNFLLMFVGWEGVGVCSYLLVCFWFTRIAANQSSISAFLTNRVGDCFLTVGMFVILYTFGNIDYSTVFSLAPFINENIVTIIGICLIIGAMAKSSQVGLHVWLPMAMEGPTPVSALIHAATMVTAGVYLLMRTSPLIEYSSIVLISCLWLGAITTVVSSLIGLFQQDIKKVIAYSTMSQLGMMVLAVGLSSYNIALFHLINHAFYKALLFLGAGAVIHAVSDNQDFRRYGGLKPFLPLTYSVILIASLSLVAFPFMTGFYSKDFIIESAYGQFYFSSIAVYFISSIGAMFTTLYSVKVLYLTFLTNPNGPIVNYKNAHEGDIYMSLPLIILAVFSIFFGYITKDIFIGLATSFFLDNSIFIHPSHEIMLSTEFSVPTFFKLLPLVFTVLLTSLSVVISEIYPMLLLSFKFTKAGYVIYSFFNQRFFIELFYNNYITNVILNLGSQTTKVIDKGSIEIIGPFGLEKGLLNLSNSISRLDTGVITSYALYILVGFLLFIVTPYMIPNLIDNSLLLISLLSLFVIVRGKGKVMYVITDKVIYYFRYLLNNRYIFIIFIIIIFYLKSRTLYCEHSIEWRIYFQDNINPQGQELIYLHDNIMFYLAIIYFSIGWILLSKGITIITTMFSYNKFHNKYHEVIILSPGLILLFMSLTSFKLLYLMTELTDSSLTLVPKGYQEYCYQYPELLDDDDQLGTNNLYDINSNNSDINSSILEHIKNKFNPFSYLYNHFFHVFFYNNKVIDFNIINNIHKSSSFFDKLNCKLTSTEKSKFILYNVVNKLVDISWNLNLYYTNIKLEDRLIIEYEFAKIELDSWKVKTMNNNLWNSTEIERDIDEIIRNIKDNRVRSLERILGYGPYDEYYSDTDSDLYDNYCSDSDSDRTITP